MPFVCPLIGGQQAEERLRDETRRGAEVVVRVRDIVRVELGLVVEVEVRSVAELTIAVIGCLP
jgi:hypothetical protein